MSRMRQGGGSAHARNCVIISVFCIVAVASGCEQLDARREIKNGNKLYEKGDYSKAVEAFERGVALAPDLDIGHHNLGLAYYKMFQTEGGSDRNQDRAKELADKAAEHLGAYLSKHPKDRPIIELVSRIWLDSGQFDKALAYWQRELDKDPNNIELISLMAGINRQAGRWQESMRWHQTEAAANPAPSGKVSAYLSIARLALNKLMNRDKVVGAERLLIADYGIAAMLAALPLQPAGPDPGQTVKAQEIISYLRALYEFRAMAHGARWAWAVDLASNQKYNRAWVELDKTIQKNQPPALGPGAAPGPPRGTGSSTASRWSRPTTRCGRSPW